MQDREQMIVQLQSVITESAEKGEKLRRERDEQHKAELQEKYDQHEKVIKEISGKLLQTQEENAKLSNEIA